MTDDDEDPRTATLQLHRDPLQPKTMAQQFCLLLHGRPKHVALAQYSRSWPRCIRGQLARKYHHPDKNGFTATGLTVEEGTELFKLLNNANDYLKERS